MRLVTTQEMVAAEKITDQHGFSYDQMMENAGQATANAIDEQFGASGQQITVLVGPGNNGGDGLVAARHLSQLGASVSLYVWRRKALQTDPNWQRLQPFGLPVIFQTDDPTGDKLIDLIDRSAILVDALLGTGVSRPIEGSLATLLTLAAEAVNRRRTPAPETLIDPLDPPNIAEIGPAIVAVDMPSGLQTDTGALDPLTLPADLTVTFAAPKIGQFTFPGALYVGQLIIADIGIPQAHIPGASPQLVTPELAADLLPERPVYGHKGTFGRALIVAGCQNYTGAPRLAGLAAYRVGAGLVTVATPQAIQPIVAAGLTEATYLPLPEQNGSIDRPAAGVVSQSLPGYSALLVGPGLGQSPHTEAFLRELFNRLPDLPVIVDADGLNLLAKQPNWWEQLPAGSILTPHPGEMSRLSGKLISEIEANRFAVVAKMAQTWNQIVVYKGAFTVIAEPDGLVMVMPFANPALATAGSGDVLAGSIAGLLAQRLPAFEAAVAGVYLHGLAGELAREKFGEAGVIAGDLLPLLPLAIKELLQG